MALHFERDEFAARLAKTRQAMEERGLDAMLLFAQESMYWLTGYDSFGYCFFQCLVLDVEGGMTLLTRAPDLRQAQHTSIIEDIRVWVDRDGAHPRRAASRALAELRLAGTRLGVEYDTHGLTAANGRAVDGTLDGFAALIDASDLIPRLRAVKSAAEIAYAREAARLADEALAAGIAEIGPGADEGRILAAMQGAILAAGGDYPANEFIIGSGADALLCRYKSGRRRLDARDQITLEFAGVSRHYHAALMRTIVVGDPTTPPPRSASSGARGARRGRDGDASGENVRRRVRCARGGDGRAWPCRAQAQRLRLQPRCPLRAELDGLADVLSR